MKAESPAIDQANIMSMAACLMGKIDGVRFVVARDLLADPNRTLLREKWLPVAETALTHFNFLQRPTPEIQWQYAKPAALAEWGTNQAAPTPASSSATSNSWRQTIRTIIGRYIYPRQRT